MTANRVLSRLHQQRNQLIESIYQSAVQPKHWHHFMGSLINTLDGRSARLLFMNPVADQVRASFKVNIDDGFHQQYIDYYVNACPWRPELAGKPKGRMYSTFLDFSCSQKQFHGTEFYHDWARLQGIEHGICGTVTQDRQTTVQFLVQRTAEAGYFTHEETDFVNRQLLPHMRAALTLAEQLEVNQQRTEAIVQASNFSPMPFALLDRQLKISYLSATAQEILRRHDLKIQSDQLVCRQPHEHEQLRQLLRKTLNGMRNQWREVGGQMAVSSGQGILELMCFPLHPILEDHNFWKQGFVVLFLNEQRRRLSLNKLWVQEKFKITHAEISLVEALINGLSLQEFADSKSTSIHTVRSQCKSVLRKTDCPRQAALIRVMLPYLAM